MITPSQILLSSLIIFIITRTIIAYKQKSLREGFVLIWLIFWTTGLFLIFQQELTINIANKLGISRGVDLVIYISLITIFYMIYRLLVSIYELNQKITKIVRNIALNDIKKKA